MCNRRRKKKQNVRKGLEKDCRRALEINKTIYKSTILKFLISKFLQLSI